MDDEEKRKKENLPDEFDGHIDCASLAICCSFSRTGGLLGVGCNDGRVVIWDFRTRCMAKNILAHAGQTISSISWSRKAHTLVSASLDNSLAIWKVTTGECLLRWIFKAPLVKVQFNPRNENLVLVCPLRHPSILLKIDYNTGNVQHKFLPHDKEDSPDANMVASFDCRGEYIYTGGTKGRITIFKCPRELHDNIPFEIVSSFKIQQFGSSPACIHEIEFAKNKRYFLVNSSDRVLRLYDCDSALKAGVNGHCDEVRKFQDIVCKTGWKRCCFSGDKDATYICGGIARQHSLYIWDLEEGTVKKMLHGAKGETLIDIQWHPRKPIIASISSGMISLWFRAEIENWSAYQPEFKELEENSDHSESESEFDIMDEDKERKKMELDAEKLKQKKKDEEEDDGTSIDIENIKFEEGDYRSSDEEEYDPSALEFLPISLEDHEMVESAQTH